jgi:hypothetical protein
MKNKGLALCAVVGLGLVLAGCIVSSVYPFYTEKDLVAEPALAGSWIPVATNQNKEVWIFEKSGERSYRTSIIDNNETNVYSMHVFKLNGQQFMDTLPLQKNGGDGGIPAHLLLKISQLQPTLQLGSLNYKWMDDFLQKNPRALHHLTVRDDPDDTNTAHLVLTGETRELQKFISKHLDDTNLFYGLGEMKRTDTGH